VNLRLLTRPAIASLALCVSFVPAAHALERVYLTTGFSYDCTRQEPADTGHIRLYLYTPGSPAQTENYVVVSSQQIVSVEPIPDPQPAQPLVAAAAVLPTADVNDLLAKAGAQHNIDAELLASVVKAESGGRSNAVSRAGARGLMQLMPGTAQQLGVDDAFNPGQNIAGGTTYLDYLLTRYDADGSRSGLDKALAAYNAGPAAVDKYHGIPPFRETRAYVARVEAEFVRRKKAAARKTASQPSPAAASVALKTVAAN
jgi:soluble lytic murein transglycosylase-like protein